MLSKNQIKKIRALQRKKERKNTGLYVVEGKKIVGELLQSDAKWFELYAIETWFDEYPEYMGHKSCFKMSAKDLAQVSSLKTPNEVLLVMQQTHCQDFSSLKSEYSVLLALDGVKDPGNMGTIIRMADWFGIKHILCTDDTVDQYNPKTVQSAMGSINRVEVHYGDLATMLKEFNEHTIYACDLSGDSLYKTDFSPKSIILMGSESHGISDEILSLTTKKITIPSFSNSTIDSLNVATATAIVLSELKGKA